MQLDGGEAKKGLFVWWLHGNSRFALVVSLCMLVAGEIGQAHLWFLGKVSRALLVTLQKGPETSDFPSYKAMMSPQRPGNRKDLWPRPWGAAVNQSSAQFT